MKRIKIKKKWIITGSIILLLIIVRLMLPFFVTRYVNKVLADLQGYDGSISGVSIYLIRGAYSINDLKIFKIEGNDTVPFIDFPVTDLSVEWRALLNGSVVGEVVIKKPKLNFIGGDGESVNQTGTEVDWVDFVKKLVPLKINRMEIVQGTVFFYDFTTKPKVSLYLDSLDVLATNLNNAQDITDPLPSSVSATATSIGGGKLEVQMDINVLKKIPDLDADLKFENVNMPALNDFFLAYSKVDIESGSFSLFSEVTIDSGNIRGYIKPIAKHIKVVDWERDKQNPLNLIWQSIIGVLAEVFENQKQSQFATKVPIEGKVSDIEAALWPAVFNILKNAFVKAFAMNTENSVEFVDADRLQPDGSRKEERKARRKERRSGN
jgi:Domain of Unknown Function (DUF748)